MTTDRDGPRSNPYRPTEMACEACCFGGGEHEAWCEVGMAQRVLRQRLSSAIGEFYEFQRLHGVGSLAVEGKPETPNAP